MFIGELSELTGVSTRMLRYYEERGLLAPDRLDNGYRVYDHGDVARVRCLKELFAHGLTSNVVVATPEYMSMLSSPDEITDPEHDLTASGSADQGDSGARLT